MSPSASPSRAPALPALAMLWLAGLSLRVTVLALPAVMNQVAAALRLDGGAVGLLTAIPSLCFAVAAIPGALLIRRIGAPACLLAGLALDVAGAVARGAAPGVGALALATGVMALGIALMQGRCRRWSGSGWRIASGSRRRPTLSD